jgi:hypothetical protein
MEVQPRHQKKPSASARARRRSYLSGNGGDGGSGGDGGGGASAEQQQQQQYKQRKAAALRKRRGSVTLAGTPGLDAVDELALRGAIWWWSSHKLFRLAQSQGVDDCGPDGLKTALLNDATAWIITAVLLMTVGFGLLVVPAGNFMAGNDFNSAVTYAFVGTALCSSMSAMVAVVAATCEYVFLNSIPAIFIGRSIAMRVSTRRWFEETLMWIFVSFSSTGLAVSCVVYLLYGGGVFLLAMAIFMVMMSVCSWIFRRAIERGWKFKAQVAEGLGGDQGGGGGGGGGPAAAAAAPPPLLAPGAGVHKTV